MTDTMVLEQGRIHSLGREELTRLRFLAVIGLVALNAVDLLLTRHLLSQGAAEANPLMALVIGGGWGIALKLGIPILAGYRHLTAPLLRKAVLALCWVNVLYLGVVAWNFHILVNRVG
ncbi:MAG: DUF5658 family protein [Acidimicrobiales bacterium]